MIIINKEFSDRLQKILESAQSKAIVAYNQELTCKHLLAAMLEEGNFLHFALNHAQADKAAFSSDLTKLIKAIPQVKGGQDSLRMGVALSRVLTVAKQFAGSVPLQEADVLIAMVQDGEQDAADLLKK